MRAQLRGFQALHYFQLDAMRRQKPRINLHLRLAFNIVATGSSFSSANSTNCAVLTWATTSRDGVFSARIQLGGLLSGSKSRGVFDVQSEGLLIVGDHAFSLRSAVFALTLLQKFMMCIAAWTSAGQAGGRVGFALRALALPFHGCKRVSWPCASFLSI